MGDAWVRKVRFIVPRYCDGTDLSGYQFSVHFINNTVNEGYYPVPSITTNADTIEFDWLVSPIACSNVGTTTASISATDSDGETIAHRFSSTTYSFKVLPSNDTQDQSIIEQAGAMDVLIDGWRDLVNAAVEDAEQAAQAAQDVADTYAAELAKKANADGHSQHLTAGFADNLTPSGESVSAEFIARQSGGDGAARIESVKGNAVVWNQLVNILTRSVTASGVTYTGNADGTVSLSGTATKADNFTLDASKSINVVNGHKFISLGGDRSKGVAVAVIGVGTMYPDTVYTASTNQIAAASIRVDASYSGDYTFKPQIFDLTRMFGQGNEPATVAEFEALYPQAYYPYDSGTLLPVRMEGVETVGFNQWDEQWEVGGIDQTTGEPVSSSTTIRSKNFTPVFPSTDYYIKAPSAVIIHYYDADHNQISMLNGSNDRVFTTPAGCRYIKLRAGSAYGATYNHDICINLSDPDHNGEYEPYWQSVREIPAATYFPDGMFGANVNNLERRDALHAGKYVKRYTEKTISGNGTITAGSGAIKFYASLQISGGWASGDNWESAAAAAADAPYGDVVVSELLGFKDTTAPIYINRTWNGLFAYTNVLTDQSAFETEVDKLTGTKLAIPVPTTTTEIDPPLNLDYKVSDFGTERIAHTEPTAPVPMEIAYGIDAAATLAGLPTDYISHESMARFIAAVEQHFGVTVTETWDETNKRYDYTIA